MTVSAFAPYRPIRLWCWFASTAKRAVIFTFRTRASSASTSWTATSATSPSTLPARFATVNFERIAYETAATGAPVLPGALAHFDCEVDVEHHAGSHSIFVGRVVALGARDGAPLGYFDGAFRDFGL